MHQHGYSPVALDLMVTTNALVKSGYVAGKGDWDALEQQHVPDRLPEVSSSGAARDVFDGGIAAQRIRKQGDCPIKPIVRMLPRRAERGQRREDRRTPDFRQNVGTISPPLRVAKARQTARSMDSGMDRTEPSTRAV